MKKIFLTLFIILANIFLINSAEAGSFTINSYKVDMNIDENNIADIHEEIDITFFQQTNGILRSIPQKKEITTKDGKEIVEKAKITDVKVSQQFTQYENGDNLVLKIGKPKVYADYNTKYKISYKYQIPKDMTLDKLYQSVIDNSWDADIKHAEFNITFPEGFEAKKVWFDAGYKGNSPGSKRIKYRAAKNTVKGYANNLKPYEGIILKTNVKKWKLARGKDGDTILIILTMLFTSLPFILSLVLEEDEETTPIVCFNAPKNINSAELEVKYSGCSTSKGITSLIFYLANKGYLKIINDNQGSYTIKKLKPYDGQVFIEDDFMEALFPNEKTEISKSELISNPVFGKQCLKIKNKLEKYKDSLFKKFFGTFERKAVFITMFPGLYGLILYTLGDYSFVLFNRFEALLFGLVIMAAIFIFIAYLQGKKPINIIFSTIFFCIFAGIPIVVVLNTLPNLNNNYHVALIQLIFYVMFTICFHNMPKRSKKDQIILRQIDGLKKYLGVIEKSKLDIIINENQNYISEILSFAYVLNVLEHLTDCLASQINSYKPDWYEGDFNKTSIFNFADDFSSLISSYNTKDLTDEN